MPETSILPQPQQNIPSADNSDAYSNMNVYKLFHDRHCFDFSEEDMLRLHDDCRSNVSIHKKDWNTLQGDELFHNSRYRETFSFKDFRSIPASYFIVRDDENMESDMANRLSLFKQLENKIVFLQYPDSSSFSTTFHVDLNVVNRVYSPQEILEKFEKKCHPFKFYLEFVPLNIDKYADTIQGMPEYHELLTSRISNLRFKDDKSIAQKIWIPADTFNNFFSPESNNMI